MGLGEADPRGAELKQATASSLISGVGAIIFDMDGTLVDSERITEQVVHELLDGRGLSSRDPGGRVGGGSKLSPQHFEGRTWDQIERTLGELFVELAGEPLAAELQRRFDDAWRRCFPPAVPGAIEALRAAAACFPVGITTSSVRPSLELLLDEHNLREVVAATICAEDCERHKPDAQPYLKTAAALDVAPERCLVFEDSDSGLSAARAAGARTVAITRGAQPSAVALGADARIDDFRALPPSLFASGHGSR
jgi:beta-phosphoglucomutase-like phosphatase (HAD superfamily)